jgi:hypothetical protein
MLFWHQIGPLDLLDFVIMQVVFSRRSKWLARVVAPDCEWKKRVRERTI